MAFLATGLYRLERGNAPDQFGDDADVLETVQRDQPGAVVERNRTTYDPASARPISVVICTGRFRAGTDVRAGDRVVDQADETRRWVVEDAHQPASITHLGDVVCNLTRNTAT